jgi:N-[(2S)-2-amino-2-carboxyethyl]-L-glutamate dehydrogenase
MTSLSAPLVPPAFHVHPGDDVRRVLDDDLSVVVTAVENAYRAHALGRTVNPDSHFLRFPERPADRIIALPAHYVAPDGDAITGIKWISSFPGNIEGGLARASAVMILNDATTGYPVACMEAGAISATRTAASAASALRLLSPGKRTSSLTVVGAGVISERVLTLVEHVGHAPDRIVLYDLDVAYASSLADRLRRRSDVEVVIARDIEDAVRSSDVVLFATTAGAPHVMDPDLLSHNPIVLHLSLRDLGPEVILSAHNVVDDVDHCLKAETSLHLTEQLTGNRDFVRFTLPELLSGGARPVRDRPIIFSPFGMGILDIALGSLVHRALQASSTPVDGFFHRAERI